VLLFIGGCYLKGNSSGSAPLANKDITNFFSSVKKIDGQAESHYKMAIYFQQRKRHKIAIDELSKAIQCDPTMTKAYNAMGISYNKLRNYERAVYCYKLALKIDPSLDYVYNNLGFSYFRQGKLDSAIDAFKNAIALNGQKERYHNNLGLAYAKKSLFYQAFAEFVLATDEARAHFNLAKIYYDLGQYEKAKFHFAEALNLDPSSTEAQKGLTAAEVYARINRREKPSIYNTSTDHTDENEENAFATKLETKANCDTGKVKRPKTSEIAISKKSSGKIAPLTPNTNPSQKSGYFSANGNGVHRMAERVGNYLKNTGVKVTRLTNADHFKFAETIIYYQDVYLHEAYKIAKEIPGFQNMEKNNDLSLNNVHVKVLIGKDLISYDKYFTQQSILAKNSMKSKNLFHN
jgi:tetratricopeptide (TPR) repeat protein